MSELKKRSVATVARKRFPSKRIPAPLPTSSRRSPRKWRIFTRNFPAGNPDGHQFINRTERVATFLVVGTKAREEVATYSDVDMKVHVDGGKARFTYKDGTDWTGPR